MSFIALIPIAFIIISSFVMTIALYGIQFRYFFRAWKFVFSAEKGSEDSDSYITPLQAFINTLSSSIGNGSMAGMATAMYSGGPGAAFWIFILGFLTMAVRFAEVFASTSYTDTSATGVLRGGPMVFLQHVPGKKILPTLYAFFCLFVTFVAGNAMQCNSMRLGIERITCFNIYGIAAVLFIFVLYIMLGGAQRIIAAADTIIPLKVGLFFIATIIVLVYHYQLLFFALKTIVISAFTPQAITGAVAGHTIQSAARFGVSRSVSATDAGLGTAGIFYGATGSKQPMRSGIMSMASIFISNHLVCFMLLLIYMITGVWNSGLTSTAMTSAAYESVFGLCGAWLVTFLSIIFGMGVLVSYAYIGRECWIFLTGGRFVPLYIGLYCLMAFFGAIARVDIVWNAVDFGNAGMMMINVYGLLMLLPQIRQAVKKYAF